MLILHPLHPSGPDFLLVCGCKSTTFPDTIPENTPIQDKPNSLTHEVLLFSGLLISFREYKVARMLRRVVSYPAEARCR
jgi:hypothetical protein